MMGVAIALMAAAPSEDVVRDYMLCVRRMAVRLEPSGESPTDIADAAKAFCSNSRTAALNSSRDIKGGTATSIDEMENAATFNARAQVVADRLCRRTKDCALDHVP